jgi:two-component system NtrC family sensor kinase
MLGIAKDISERKKLEQKLFQTEKLASLVTLVSGIAHELNNRLLPVLVYSELLQQSPLREGELKLIKTINRSAAGAKHIVASLLRFSRQEKPQKSSIDLNQAIRDVINILKYRISSGTLDVRLELSEALPITWADERQMEQVFMNIINNACDALEETGGVITIRSYPSGNDIFVEIMNDGPEIPKEDIPRIFDPFYTSKEVGKGTGLGLSLCYGIVHEHGGDIWVVSENGKTVFTIKVPVSKEFSPAGLDAMGSVIRRGGGGGKKRILVIDDEEDQLEVIQQILKKDFDIVACNSGDHALERLERESFDMVISDVKMPGVDGVALYHWIKDHRPAMVTRILFSTGDVLGPKFEKIIEEVDHRYILKPYDIDELIDKVQEVLEV